MHVGQELEVGALYAGRYRVEASAPASHGTLLSTRAQGDGRPAVVHVLDPADGAATERGLRALERMRRLRHPSAVPWLDAGRDRAGRLFIVAERLDGIDLRSSARPPLCPREASALLHPVAQAIAVAHGLGVTHGRLALDHIVLAPDPRVIELGLEPLIEAVTGARMGPGELCAPEQADLHAPVGPAADVWALGAILFGLLVGRPPFAGPRALVLVRVLTEVAPPLRARRADVPPALAELVDRSLRPDPSARPSMAAVEGALGELAGVR